MTVRMNAHRFSIPAAAGLLVALAGCGGGSPQQSSDLPIGSTQTDPQTGLKFVVDSNLAGSGGNLRVLSVAWGRLVDIYAPNAVTGEPEILFDDFLVGSDIASNGVDYSLVRSPGTGAEVLTILHPFGTPEFNAAFAQLESNLQLLIDKSLDTNELPPFTAMPRNAALAIRFDDLIDESTLRNTTVRVDVGYPPTSEFAARIIPDRNHGDIAGGRLRSTRVIVDMTTSEAEASQIGALVNTVGLPEAATLSQPNVALRIPTRTAVGQQFEVLTNLAGSPVSFTGNGSTDPFAPSLDVVRAFRSGGRALVTGDPFNGFLDDNAPPYIVSAQPLHVDSVVPLGNEYVIEASFSSVACAMTPRKGDIVRMLNGIYAEVLQDGTPPQGGTVFGVRVQVVEPVGAELDVGNAEYRTPWLRAIDQIARPECWVTISPTPQTTPATGISVQSSFTLLFSEPMDPGRISGFDTLQLLYGFSTPSMQSQVVGQIAASGDLSRFTFLPQLPLRHAAAGTEAYRVNLPTGTSGPVDLAGNGLSVPFTDSTGAAPDFTVAAGETPIESRSLMMKFQSPDEDPAATPPGPDLRGQIIYDLQNGRVRPRTVARISGSCDPTTPMVTLMGGGTLQVATQFWGIGQDTPLPLWRYGCRLMTIWRHPDMGFQLLDDATHNLDLEGLAWAPQGGGLQIDNFPQFQMGVAHSRMLPDEGLLMGVIVHPISSILDVFDDNLLSSTEDPLKIVHPKAKGYTVRPLDAFTSASGLRMAPWPLNRDVSQSQYQLYTWRDTAKLSRGQPLLGAGSGEGSRLINERAIDMTNPGQAYQQGQVPTIALPLLMDFRCYPDSLASSANRLTGILAVAPAGPTVLENPPYFTAWTAGNNVSGVPINIDPDQQFVAAGSNPPGGPNYQPRNQFVFFGQGDFVTRINRAHTRWFECAPSAPGGTFNFADPVIEPNAAGLPPGTQVLLHFRGATSVTGANSSWAVADNFDAYGDRYIGGTAFQVTFTGGSNTWKSAMQQIGGSQFFQVRITMISNTISGAVPEVSSLGFAFYR